MPEIKDRFAFRPGDDAISNWLSTRKKGKRFGNKVLPGLLQTAGFGNDQGWVMFAGFIEAIALTLTIQGGFDRGGLYLIGAVIAVVLFIALDIVGLIFTHKKEAINCYYKNRKEVETDPKQLSHFDYKINETSAKKIVGILALVISSVLKVVALFLLGRLSIIIYVVVLILYIILIYIHISHTGFWYFELRTNGKMAKDHKEWSSGGSGHQTNSAQFSSTFELNRNIGRDELRCGLHKIFFKGPVENKFEYELETHGLLLDDDIEMLVSGLSDDLKAEIAKYCLNHQLQQCPVPS